MKIEMRRPKFGVQFRNFPSQFDGKIIDRMVEVALNCEAIGFDSIWMVDHLEMRPPISYESQPIPECWSAISALAAATHTIKIGSLVTCTLFRNPNYFSSVCNTINELSQGRLIVGLGSGWFEEEFLAYGIPYPSASQRIASSRAALRVLRQKSIPSPFPIWLGGSGENSTLKLVAEAADGCSLFGAPEIVSRKLKILEKYCTSFNRKSQEITKSKHSNVVVGVSRSDVEHKMQKIIQDKSKWRDFISNNIVGTPDECLDQVKKYLVVGVDYFTLTFPDLFETKCLDIFSSEVIEEISSPSS